MFFFLLSLHFRTLSHFRRGPQPRDWNTDPQRSLRSLRGNIVSWFVFRRIERNSYLCLVSYHSDFYKSCYTTLCGFFSPIIEKSISISATGTANSLTNIKLEVSGEKEKIGVEFIELPAVVLFAVRPLTPSLFQQLPLLFFFFFVCTTCSKIQPPLFLGKAKRHRPTLAAEIPSSFFSSLACTTRPTIRYITVLVFFWVGWRAGQLVWLALAVGAGWIDSQYQCQDPTKMQPRICASWANLYRSKKRGG